ncbi:DEAD/DEAH box helicase [Candidatus Woesearchaeota archaeon]|nr:DEAD/DEAH box helicase [Candidatus Woesearchaeota archaeon]
MSKDFLFPYDNIRRIQADMLADVSEAVGSGKNMIAHAPTGLGKTAASIGPALKYALDNDLTVFFLTSRHTQHLIAIETLTEIKKKHGIDLNVADIIGKRWMCAMEGVQLLSSKDFSEYCKSMREEGKCEFYSRTRKGNSPTPEAKKTLAEIKETNSWKTESMIELCKQNKLCPYEMAMMLAAEANVVIADYFYIFDSGIRDTFMRKTSNDLSKSIIIVDEGHNLPSRIRDLATAKLSSFILKNAIKEAKKYGYKETVADISQLQDIMNRLGDGLKTYGEKLVKKEEFMAAANRIKDYDQLVADLAFIGDAIREQQRKSYVGSLSFFLELWPGTDHGKTRILKMSQFKNQPQLTLTYRCLDPSVFTKEIIENAHSTIIMSGTLNPTSMYKDLLGFPEDTIERTYDSPFFEQNKLTIIVPETTTKFSQRNDMQFRRIAEISSEIVNNVPGNSAVFFPSYGLRDQVYRHFYDMCAKTTFLEQPGMTKEEKGDFLERFKGYQKTGAVLLGASTGSYGEGIDLPGDFLKAVVVVGLPLEHPDLETKELIRYFDTKFSKGWDYGYIFPAFNRTMQNAGRCIRSEEDRGVVVFLDERYLWPMYRRCFNQEEDIKVSRHYKELIEEFFDPKQRKLI